MCANKIQNISEMSNSKKDGGGGKSRPKNKRQIRATTDGKPEAALGESEIMSQTKWFSQV